MKYRKIAMGHLNKPMIEFEALKFTGENIEECTFFGSGEKQSVWYQPESGLIMKNAAGDFIIEQNDWIIKLADNNFQRCKGSLFFKIYEPAPTHPVEFDGQV